MTRIQHRRGRHFMDEEGRLFWINGPDDHCYLSEQRQWRRGLCFEDVLEWKQCAPTGCVSQRFPSPKAACEAFEHAQVVWSHDVYLRRLGDAMAQHRSLLDYKPTAMRLAEAQGARPRQAPWILPGPSGPACALPAGADMSLSPSATTASEPVPHPRRRRRGAAALSFSA
ncbi:MAG: hypothetical protein FJ083_10870 [Cyanobacteria bacterium K_Offshore_surface_m2_239]|nr:hypothetical protein [Cyanobacteria bacterium K_Offshore_surface_m2_239]